MSRFRETSTEIPGGKFAIFLMVLCLALFGGIVWFSFRDAQKRHQLESSEIAVAPELGEEVFFPLPSSILKGMQIAVMDRRPLFLVTLGAISEEDDAVMMIGLEDSRTYPVYHMKQRKEGQPSSLLLKISPGSYLPITADQARALAPLEPTPTPTPAELPIAPADQSGVQ